MFIDEFCRAHGFGWEAVAIWGQCLALCFTCSPVCKEDYVGQGIRCMVGECFVSRLLNSPRQQGKESVVSRRTAPYILLYGTVYPLFPITAGKFNSSGTWVTAGFCYSCRVKKLAVQERPRPYALLLQFWRGFLCLGY